MFIKLHGVKGIRLLVNVKDIRTIQEITEDSKYFEFKEHGAKSMIQIDDKVLAVKDSIIQIENMLKKLGQIGGSS